jgi:penicillin amidase
MTKKFLGIIILLLTTLIIYFLSKPIGDKPAIGALLSPTHGFWKNIEKAKTKSYSITLKGKNSEITIAYDENGIPHIFADNESDMYYAQGYITAKDRLWQMDFITRFASGRISEIVGEDALNIDRYNRRIGLVKSAQESVEYASKDPKIKVVLNSYTQGVNDYMKTLNSKNIPFEFKLLGYKPEPWTTLKCGLIMKYMADELTGIDTDVEYTNAINLFGKEVFEQLYPDFPENVEPIVPSGTNFAKASTTSGLTAAISKGFFNKPNIGHDYIKGLGSNNWAINKEKTYSGSPILCNDPHLRLKLPSIWYEIQLNCPTTNAYGVSIPGGPCILIGYNDSIAHGATNGTMDVRDWFSLDINPNNKNQYQTNRGYLDFEIREEKIFIKGKSSPFIDKVKWTKSGPVVYDDTYGQSKDKKMLTLAWVALMPSEDIKTFYLLNHAKNLNDYENALSYYSCPAQNFIYSDANNIAIHEQGNMWIRAKDEGKFIRPLSSVNIDSIYTNFIPKNKTPYSYNPARNFVSSANQHPTDASYPYYYYGTYENYRNRRINELLSTTTGATVEEMKKMQYDQKSLLAEDILPFMLSAIVVDKNNVKSLEIFNQLKKWNFIADYNIKEPSYFYKWWSCIENLAYDELQRKDISLVTPENYTTAHLLKQNNLFQLFDIKKTEKVETGTDIIQLAYYKMIDFFEKNPDSTQFMNYKQSNLTHLAQIGSLSIKYLPTGGYHNIINATAREWGASWRMVVDFKDKRPQGYGIYPGGQSGNPGSTGYTSFVQNWINGDFFKHHFYKDKNDYLKSLKQ